MLLERVVLQNFRSFAKRSFDLGRTTVVVGENGAGKSNLLEAIYLLAVGKSFRADMDSEMIRYGERFSIINSSFKAGSRFAGQFANNDQIQDLQITLTDGSIGVSRKKFEVNGVSKRMIDVVGKFRAVLFSPQDLELVTGNPSGRRKYLDFVISQVDREYRRCLVSYEKGLRQRNKLLEMIRDGIGACNQLFFWDRLLIKNGNYLTDRRGEYLASLNTPSVSPPSLGGGVKGGYGTVYDASVISQARLEQYAVEEVAAAATLVGPHRDDFTVNLDGRDVSKFGSRGEQRMAVLWLKQGELKYLDSETRPALLLDDIFSELDSRHRGEVLALVSAYSGQVVITTTDLSRLRLDHGDWTHVHLGG